MGIQFMNQNDIKSALAEMQNGNLLEKSKNLLSTLGYRSDLTLELSGTVNDFFDEFPAQNPNTKTEQHFRDNAESVQIIFQLTKDEIVDEPQLSLLEPKTFDKGITQSFLFCAVELKNNSYSRTKYAEFTREINKRLFTPTVIIFRAGELLTIAFADRRPNITDESRDVLGQVTLIKDILLNHSEREPHRAHLDILSDLSLEQCIKWMDDNRKPKNFDGLLAAWLAKLDTEELNKQFYRKLFTWYEWAVETAKFPTEENRVIKAEEHVIRLITRLLFIWFIKEKGLVAEELFNKAQIQELLVEDDFEDGDSYYRAVLQNLFFATLNTEIDRRKFSTEGYSTNRDFSRYRYKAQMEDPDRLLELFAETPFINGGLFDCLDSWEATGEDSYRIDCFSDNQYHGVSISNRLFFDKDGLIPLLEHYKFTVEENTPIDQEVALDPELLGRVFENLLAAYNPETGETARKITGSYYTPRAIVDYMVEEALVASLSEKCQPVDENEIPWEKRLHYLFDYAKVCDDASVWFNDNEIDEIVRTISELKILDPAVGSGAFPMGVLHKLTLALRRLDPDNTRWEALQRKMAIVRSEKAYNTQDQQERNEELTEISDTFERYRDSDFGRKLYLIQNSIFGVDIQPIACQIAKLRFFISLAIEQEPNTDAENNFGIKPLPNLETRFIAANTLIGFSSQRTFTNQKVVDLERELRNNREQHFHATTRQKKRRCKEEDERLRAELGEELQELGMLSDEAEKIAHWDIYDQNASADWFDPEWMFGNTDGFDMVIGNPPYIQLQRDGIQLQRDGGRLADLYQPCEFDSFTRMGDIYCLFYEKGHKLLNKNGHLCYITSNKWMRAGYGKKLRDYFITHTQPIQLLDMGPDVFDATVDTNILLFQNAVSDVPNIFSGVSIGVDFDKQTDDISQYLTDNGSTMDIPTKGEPWAILSSAELNLKHKIEDIGIPLKDWDINIYRGITTGYNDAFIIDATTREQLITQDPISVEIIKPILRGSNLKRYHAQWEELYLLFIPWHFPLHEDSTITGASQEAENVFVEDYPSIYSHLQQYQDRLSNRNRSETGIRYEWYALQRCAATYHSEFNKKKIIWQEIAKIGSFLIDKDNFYSLDTTRILTGENLTYLVGILNSMFFLYAFKNYYAGGHLGSKGVRFKSEFMKGFPIPPITNENQHIATQIEDIVEQILVVKQADPDADTSEFENEIDTLVYELYNLTEKEIAIVEEAV